MTHAKREAAYHVGRAASKPAKEAFKLETGRTRRGEMGQLTHVYLLSAYAYAAPAGSVWQVPRTLISPRLTPISSRVSLSAAPTASSPTSRCPPGKDTCTSQHITSSHIMMASMCSLDYGWCAPPRTYMYIVRLLGGWASVSVSVSMSCGDGACTTTQDLGREEPTAVPGTATVFNAPFFSTHTPPHLLPFLTCPLCVETSLERIVKSKLAIPSRLHLKAGACKGYGAVVQ